MKPGRGRCRRFVAGLAVFVAGTVGAFASEPLAESYLQAQEFGRRDEAEAATGDYHRTVLLPEFSARFRAHLRECQAAQPQPDQTPFSFVAAIGADGAVLRMWSDRAPPVYACVRGRLLFERFTPPPRAPFYLYIHMRFAN